MYKHPVSNSLFESSDDDEETFPLTKRRDTVDEKLWDSFEDPPDPKSSGSGNSTKYLDASIKLLKVFTYIFVFLVVLISSVLSKMSFLFMTSHIKRGVRIPYCHVKQPQKQFEALIPDVQRIAWFWALIFAFCVPETATLLRSFRICYFKSFRVAKWSEIILIIFAETMHVLGMGILVFLVLPELDVIKGIMLTNCVCLIPAILGMLAPASNEARPFLKFVMDIFAICAQLTGCIAWPLLYGSSELWLIPTAIVLISFHWWENFVSPKSPFSFIKKLASLRENLTESRYYIYCIVAPYKMLLFIACGVWTAGYGVNFFFTSYSSGWGNHTISVEEVKPIFTIVGNLPNYEQITMDLQKFKVFPTQNAILWVWLVQVISSYLAFVFAKFASKIHIQTFSFSFPINLTVPIGVFSLLAMIGFRQTNVCCFHHILPDYMFFTTPPVYYIVDFLGKEFAWVWLLWLLSQTWVTRYLWRPKSDKNASTEKLFITPWYNALLIDQSLTLNRRRVDQEEFVKKINIHVATPDPEIPPQESEGTYDPSSLGIQPYDKIPQVFICATMWHENKEEMMEFLKSILRLDEDQCARRMAKKYIQVDPNEIDHEYYDLETHIFFDDAFVSDKRRSDLEVSPLNEYVKLLINILEEAALEVYKTKMRIYPPTKIVTPYGGRLIWTLPGRTKMVAHLKDKNKIRHKKRWSQCMYMYYLLGYRIMQMDCNPERKMVIAQNTYLLALDGDIDFQPKAVRLLISRMKVDPDLGAACGRIHPVGSGPMVWYQTFEYAIGHWLQKATEHIIGCVLCSPGCFSLFRGRALMENSVMRKYTTKSSQARHYVQYDQGEDRWLCTLLLKQKFRVEYSAASDAYTHAPEGFNEFYNQRRRWVPSTMANIFDLLADAKRIVKNNNSISMPYITYQAFLMFGTILGPGTIFLMMVGAVLSVFNMDIWTSFLWNFIPLATFMFICYYCKQKHQLMAAFSITAAYSLVMMAVMVGIIIQVMDDGVLAPTSLFFFTVALQVIITALLHPQELYALPAGIVYYITIPSMYMLLVIYSLFNMNDVSWGTRENPPSADEAPAQNTQSDSNANQTRVQKMFAFLRPNTTEESGSLDFSFAGLFRCMCCTHAKVSGDHEQLVSIAASLSDLNTKMKALEVKLTGEVNVMRDDDDEDDENMRLIQSPSPTTKAELGIAALSAAEKIMATNYPPDWLYDTDLKNGDTESLSSSEEQFWIDLIEKYLKPLELQQKDKDAVKESLNGLRDMAIFAFVMANALFVLIVFLLQLHKSELHIRWPYNAKNKITYDESVSEVLISRTYLEVEPIGLMFVFFFGLILLIQFVAMLMHRFTTISQILASTTLDWYCGKNAKQMSVDAEIRQNAVDLAFRLQKPKPIWDEDNLEEDERAIGRRDTIRKILHQRKNKKDWSNLEANFERSFLRLNKKSFKVNGLISKEAFDLLDNRRKSQVQQIEKRQSMMAEKQTKFQKNKTPSPPGYRQPNTLPNTAPWTPELYGNGVNNFAFEPTENEFEGGLNSQSPGILTIGSNANEEAFEMHERSRNARRQSRVTFA